MSQGMDPGEINAMRKARKAAEFEVWEENWEALSIFLRCQTQWRVSMSGLCGLDYTVVAWLLKLYEVEDERLTLERLQVIEATVLQILNSKGSQ
jgi:hypothetical protein